MKEKEKKYTDSGIEIKPVYSSADQRSLMDENPGVFPFTRGVQADMYRGKLWTMRQYAGFSTAEESNKRYHYLLSQGVNGLSVAFDLPTQIGYDSDHALAEGEVGKVGVAIDSMEDMQMLFNGYQSRRCIHVDDDQCDRFYFACILCCPCKAAGRRSEKTIRHNSK